MDADIVKYQSDLIRLFQPETVRMAQEKLLKFSEVAKHTDVVLAFSHSNYLTALGGTEKVLHQEQRQLAKHGISYIQVYGIPDGTGLNQGFPDQRVGVNVDSTPVGILTVSQLALSLMLLIRDGRFHLLAAHLHHLMNLSSSAVKFVLKTTHPGRIRIFVHDYYTICPQFNLLRNGKWFCGGDCQEQECASFEERGPHLAKMKALFKDLEFEVIAPSSVAADIWSLAFPAYARKVRVVPHLVQGKKTSISMGGAKRLSNFRYRPRIAYLGYESVNKGLEAWWRLVNHPRLSKKYAFFHLGAAGIRKPDVRYVNVSFLEKGDDAMVVALKQHHIDAAFLWSICPETYSFTLFEAFSAGCFVLTNSLSGNIAAQVNGSSRGAVFGSEQELWDALDEREEFKSRLLRNLQENPSPEFVSNPKLAMETANLKAFQFQKRRKDGEPVRWEANPDEHDPLFNMLLVECLRGKNQEKDERKVFQHCISRPEYGISRIDELIEMVRQYCRRHVVVGKFMRKVATLLLLLVTKERKT